MKATILACCAALAWSLPTGAAAQTANDDVRCVLLSAGFARVAKDDNSRRALSLTGAFYLGRLNGRVSGTALSAAIRAQGKGLPAKQAEQAMRACAARAASAEQEMAAATKNMGAK